MKTHVTVIVPDRAVSVDGCWYLFSEALPDVVASLHAVQWHEGKGEIEFADETLNLSIQSEEEYATYVEPFVTLWEEEKARREAEANRPLTLEEVKAAQLTDIGKAFTKAEASGHLLSSLGFRVDANERANRDVGGLITMLEARGEDTAYFCDYENTMRPVSLEDLKTIQLEIIAYGQSLYAKKWALREAVNAAETVEEVQAVRWMNGDAA